MWYGRQEHPQESHTGYRPGQAGQCPPDESHTDDGTLRQWQRARRAGDRRGNGKGAGVPGWAASATAVVIVVIVVLVSVGLSSGGAKAAPRTPVPATTAQDLQSVSLSTLVAASTKVSDLHPATQLNGPP